MPVALLSSPNAGNGNRRTIGAQGDLQPENVVGLRVRRFEIGLLSPDTCVANENIDSARIERGVVRLVAVDAGAALSSRLAPTASVEPSALSAIASPNWSPFSAFDALMYACCDQTPGALRKDVGGASGRCQVVQLITADAGRVTVFSAAPTASVVPSPLRATARPNASLVSVFDALMYACCDQHARVTRKHVHRA